MEVDKLEKKGYWKVNNNLSNKSLSGVCYFLEQEWKQGIAVGQKYFVSFKLHFFLAHQS